MNDEEQKKLNKQQDEYARKNRDSVRKDRFGYSAEAIKNYENSNFLNKINPRNYFDYANNMQNKYKRQIQIGKDQYLGYKNRLKDKDYMKGVATQIVNSDEKAYNQKQKSEIQSKLKINSSVEQRAAKIALDVAKKNPAVNAISKIPGVGPALEGAASAAASKAIAEVKKKAKSALIKNILMPVFTFLFGPPFFLVELGLLVVCIFIIMAGYLGYYDKADRNTDQISTEQAQSIDPDFKEDSTP